MRRRWLLAAVASLGGFALEMACGEPYEGEIPNTSAPTRDGATSEDASDARSPEPEADAAPDAAADAAPGKFGNIVLSAQTKLGGQDVAVQTPPLELEVLAP